MLKDRSAELVLGQLFGQLALLLAIPFLTRMLPVYEMGVYQTGFAFALIIQPLATLRRELLIPFSSSSDAQRHRVAGLRFAAGLCALIAVAGGVSLLWGSRDFGSLALVAALVLFSFALLYVENAYLIRLAAKRRLAARNLAGGVLSAMLQILVAALFPTAVGIAVALLLGRALATALTISRHAIPKEEVGGGERTKQRTISAILSAMVATASSQAMVIGVFATLGAYPSAQVGVGQRIAGAPSSLVGQAFTQLALNDAAPMIRNRQAGLTRTLLKRTLGTAVLATCAACVIGFAAPLLAEPILGSEYREAGVLTAYLAVPLALTLVALPATSLLIPLGRERLLFVIQLARLVFISGALLGAAVVSGDLHIVVLTVAVVWTLAYIPLLVAAFAATRHHDRSCGGLLVS